MSIVSFHMVTGGRRWFIVGGYLVPDDAPSIYFISGAVEQCLRGVVIMVVLDLNTDIADPEENRIDSAILAALSDTVMEDMSGHFLPFRITWERNGWTWIIIIQGRVVRSHTDYIIGTD